jgi:uncharacterized membrane protein
MSQTSAGPSTSETVRRNIETILQMENSYLRRRTIADRLADAIAAFTGTLWFVLLHIVWFAVWAVVNLGVLPGMKAFDPYPFALLTMIVSMEGVLIATFVLIKQNRMGYMSDRRAHVDLQINLLSEREVTRLLQLSENIARHVGVPQDEVASGLSSETRVERLVESLDSRMSAEAEAGPKEPKQP